MCCAPIAVNKPIYFEPSDGVIGCMFGLLGLAVAMATVFPTLGYMYSKEVLKSTIELRGKITLTEWQSLWKNSLNFIAANDLILTQTIFKVMFNSAYGIMLFMATVIKIKPGWNCHMLLTFFIVAIFGFKFWFLIWSRKKIKEVVDVNRELNLWLVWWKRIIALFLIFTLLLNFIIYFCSAFGSFRCRFLPGFFYWFCEYISIFSIFLLAILSIELIFYATAWVWPLIKYTPLQEEIKQWDDIFNPPQPPPAKRRRHFAISFCNCCKISISTTEDEGGI